MFEANYYNIAPLLKEKRGGSGAFGSCKKEDNCRVISATMHDAKIGVGGFFFSRCIDQTRLLAVHPLGGKKHGGAREAS